MPKRNQHALDFLHENDNSDRRRLEHQASASPHEVSTRAHEVDVSLAHLNHNTSGFRKVLTALVVVGLSSPVLIVLLSHSSKNTSEPNAVAPVTSNMLPEAPDPSVTAPVATPAPVDTSVLTTAIVSASTQSEVHTAIAELVRRSDIIGSDRSALFQLAAETEGELGVQAADLRAAQITSSIADLHSNTRITELTAELAQIQSGIQALRPGVGSDAFVTPEQKQELERLFNARRVYLSEEKKKYIQEQLENVIVESRLKFIEKEIQSLERLFSTSLFNPVDFQDDLSAARGRIRNATLTFHGAQDQRRAEGRSTELEALIDAVSKNDRNWERTLETLRSNVTEFAQANSAFQYLFARGLLQKIEEKMEAIRGELSAATSARAQVEARARAEQVAREVADRADRDRRAGQALIDALAALPAQHKEAIEALFSRATNLNATDNPTAEELNLVLTNANISRDHLIARTLLRLIQ